MNAVAEPLGLRQGLTEGNCGLPLQSLQARVRFRGKQIWRSPPDLDRICCSDIYCLRVVSVYIRSSNDVRHHYEHYLILNAFLLRLPEEILQYRHL